MPSIRRKKSKSSDDEASTSSSRNKKIKKSIKGIIKRKKKKESVVGLSAESVPEGKSVEFNGKDKKGSSNGADEETEYGVELDKSERTADTESKGDSVESDPPAEALRLVLLLLDPYSRRFELLQLEFDAQRAYVSDVLDQIPLTATEEELRDKDYTGLSNRDGVEMEEGLLSECDYEGGVMVAIPDSLTSEQVAQLAKPILFDPKVVATFKPTTSKPRTSKPTTSKPRTSKPTTSRPTTSRPRRSKPSSSKPRRRPSRSPSPSPENGALYALPEETTKPETEAVKPETTDKTEPPPKKERSAPIAEPVKEENKGLSLLSRLILLGSFSIALLSSLFVLIQKRHTAPMSPGDILSPGEWKSTCGLLSLLPESLTECSQGVVEMGQDGVLKYSEGDEVVWSLTGGVCETGDEECTLGAVVTESGEVRIGGVEISDDLPDSWPFKKVEKEVKEEVENEVKEVENEVKEEAEASE